MKIRIGLCIVLCLLFLAPREDAHAEYSSDTVLINHLNALSWNLLDRNTDSCRLLAQQAIALSKKINYARGLGEGYTRLGVLFKREGKFDSAIVFYRKSLYYRKLSGSKRDIGSTSMNLGFAFSRVGKPDSALYYELEAIRIFEAIKDSTYLIKTLNNIGSVFQYQKNYPEAEKSYLRAIGIANSQRDSSNIFLAKGNLGGLYVDMKDYAEAGPLLMQAMHYHRRYNDKKNLAPCMNNLGRYYEKISKPDSAIFYFRKSAEMDSVLDAKREWAAALGNIGVMLMGAGENLGAISYLKKSIQITIESGDKVLTSKNFKNLAQAYSNIGNYDLAYEAQKQVQLYNDSVFNDDKAKSISEMQTKYDTEKKEQQIALLGEQNKVQRLQKNIFLAGVIALFVGALGLFIFFRQKQQIAKRSDQIQKQQISELLNTQEIKSLNAMMDGQEKERKRIAADLHDRIGSSLSAMKLHFTGFAKSMNIAPTQNEFAKVSGMFDEVVKEVRQVSHDLASGVLMKFGLVSALKDLSESIESAGTIKVNFYTLGVDERLDHRTEISLYRVTQELISNILKHAQAKEINIHLNRHNGDISLMVEDDGIGFEPAKASGGIGMRNIRSRLNQLHGNVFFDSSPGKGCTVTIELPINSKP